MAARKAASSQSTSPDRGRLDGLRFVVDKKHPTVQRRREALQFEGATLQDAPTAKTNYLVVGQGPRGKPTAAHQKALDLNANGAQIQFLDDAQFLALMKPDSLPAPPRTSCAIFTRSTSFRYPPRAR